MFADNHVFVAWEERIISQEKGNRIVHFYLKVSSGDLVLAVVGTERSIRHMIYVVSDEFVQAYGWEGAIDTRTKWRTRREVVDWLAWLVLKHHQPLANSNSQRSELADSLGSRESSMSRFNNLQINPPDQTTHVPRKLEVQNSDIVWSGDAWICCKQLKHYPSFSRNGITIAVYSFAFIRAEEESHYVAYLEDLYEDKKKQKRVKVRWFHHSQEVNGVFPQPHPKEVIITNQIQVISPECINGPATVLTPKHYEKCSAVVSQTFSSGIYLCSRQIKNNKVKPFSLNKLRGYSNQEIFSHLDDKPKKHILNEGEEEEFAVNLKGTGKRLESGHSGVTNSVPGNQVAKSEPSYQKLKIKLSSNGPVGIKLVGPEPQLQVPSLKIGEEIELLCQDSGIRGCWFRCMVLQASQKRLKVQYKDLEDVDGTGKLEEWVPALRVAAPDKLGMRCSGRLTTRPCPPKDSSNCSFEIGAPIDAWWSDGWWEGVVVGVNISGSATIRVYFPGEDRFLTLQNNKLRKSRDWVDNMWIDIKAMPDILSFISPDISPKMKLKKCSALAETSQRGIAVEEEKRKVTVSVSKGKSPR